MSTTIQRQAMKAAKFNSKTLASGLAYLDALERARCNSEARIAKLDRVDTTPIASNEGSPTPGTD